MEAAEIQSRRMEESKDSVNHVRPKPKSTCDGGSGNIKTKLCFHCGRDGHFARDSSCPARAARCYKCHKMGHFAVVCKSKVDCKKPVRGNPKGNNSYWKGVSKSVNSVDYDDGEYAFHINSNRTTRGIELIDVTVGGVELYNVMIDSGSSCLYYQ